MRALVADAATTAGWGTMQYLLILLVVLTMACGAAAGVTIAFAPAYADASGKGY
jgi:methyl coenzyme M reductase alpha subunit